MDELEDLQMDRTNIYILHFYDYGRWEWGLGASLSSPPPTHTHMHAHAPSNILLTVSRRLLTFIVFLVKCYVVFHFLMFDFQQVCMFKIIQLVWVTEFPPFLKKVSSAGQLFILRLLNCIFLSFPLVFGVRCGSDCINSLSSLIHFA